MLPRNGSRLSAVVCLTSQLPASRLFGVSTIGEVVSELGYGPGEILRCSRRRVCLESTVPTNLSRRAGGGQKISDRFQIPTSRFDPKAVLGLTMCGQALSANVWLGEAMPCSAASPAGTALVSCGEAH
jgi:hypothetical protein